MNVVIFGASGMVGSGALLECLADERVTSVLVIGRSSCGVRHLKLREILHADFFDYSLIQSSFVDRDACFFCLGVTSVGMSEEAYRRITFDLTVAAAQAMLAVNSHLTFCFISGAGSDGTGKSRVMWSRVKGDTENALLAMPFHAAFMFRPAFIQPMKGAKSKTRLYGVFYALAAPFYPVLQRLFPRLVTTTENVGRALIRVSDQGYPSRILETEDINRIAGTG